MKEKRSFQKNNKKLKKKSTEKLEIQMSVALSDRSRSRSAVTKTGYLVLGDA